MIALGQASMAAQDGQDVAERGLAKGNLELLALKAWGSQMGT